MPISPHCRRGETSENFTVIFYQYYVLKGWFWMDINKLDEAAREYFYSLTPAMRESIMQSGADLTTKNDLERYLQNTLADAKRVEVQES